jgi:hypothetical protein
MPVAWIMSCVFPIDVSISMDGSGEFDAPRGFMLTEKITASQFIRTISYFGRSQLLHAWPPGAMGQDRNLPFGSGTGAASERPPRERGKTFHLLCFGGMAPPRAFDVLLRAMAASGNRAIFLPLVGGGPGRQDLERLAVRYGVAAQVAQRRVRSCSPVSRRGCPWF